MSDAKEFLGCDSESACREFCNNPANQQKCQEFFQKEGLTTQPPTNVTNYPGANGLYAKPSCGNAESCKDFCSNSANKQACEAFASSCFNFCRGNPDKCPYLNTQNIHTRPPISITPSGGYPVAAIKKNAINIVRVIQEVVPVFAIPHKILYIQLRLPLLQVLLQLLLVRNENLKNKEKSYFLRI